MNWWHYLLLANLYLALFYGFYLLLLRNETYFMLNRIYLVSAAVLSFFIPMMQAEWVKNLFITQKVQQTIYYIDPGFVYQVSPAAESGFTVSQFFSAVYWLVTMLLLARLIYRFILLKRYISREENGSAFSFFGKVKVDENLPQKDVILQHEMVHVAQLHSADVLLFEALTILNWFNPVIYFYRKAIKHIHEFIADRDAISFGIDKSDYALLLLSESMGVQPNHLVNSFFNQSLLKQRILMLHKNPSRRAALLKYGLSAPLFAAMLILTSATVSEQKTILKISEKMNSNAPVKEVAKAIGNQTIALPKPLASFSNTILATSVLKGKVVNINGEPIVGVKISYSKKSKTIITDNDGNFKIADYNDGDLLTFEHVGFSVIAKSFTDAKGKLPVVVLQGNRSTVLNATIVNKNPVNGEPVSFTAVDKLPYFPGGEKAFSEFLARTIRYPKVARDEKVQGRVIVSFVVEKDGSLNDIKVLRDIDGMFGTEALRVLSASPKWIPGMQNEKSVRVAYTMPISFTLAGEKNTSIQGKVKLNEDSLLKRTSAVMKNVTNVTVTGFGTYDSTRQRKPAEFIHIQSKVMDLNNPIYLVDGNKVEKYVVDNTNPNDIESISVWKGPSAIRKYGDDGKNGVVEITTKKDKKVIETEKKKP